MVRCLPIHNLVDGIDFANSELTFTAELTLGIWDKKKR
jgi:hypothetical protein